MIADSTSIGAPSIEDASTDLDVSGLFAPRYPSPDLVSAAAGMLTPLRKWDGAEGPRRRIIVAPGVIALESRDLAKAERAAERAVRRRYADTRLASLDHLLPDLIEDADAALKAASVVREVFGIELPGEVLARPQELREWLARTLAEHKTPERAIRHWSAKSRARMTRRLAELDYTPLFEQGIPAMLTLTYPGEWQSVAPDAATVAGHLKAFRKRFERFYGRPLLAVWKREFQRRGAPHYHLLMVPPPGKVKGLTFPEWVAEVWPAIVGHPDAWEREKHRWLTSKPETVDMAEGMRASDPKRLAVYFTKHGTFSAKDYQNDAPEQWEGSIGRFWGYWGLERATAEVELTHEEARAAARTLRRWSRANGYRVQRTVFRVDTRTGVIRTRRSGAWVYRMRGSLGFVTVNDGPALVATLSRHLDAVRERAQLGELIALGFEPWFRQDDGG